MKRIAIAALSAAVMLTLALTACAPQTTQQADYIGIDAAKTIALEAAGVTESAATFSTAGLDKQNGTDFYAVDFTANGQSYEYDIDAVTGVIIDSNAPQKEDVSAPTDPAVSTAGSTGANPDTGRPTGGGSSGDPGTSATGGNTASNPGAGTAVTEEQARQIALDHAGFSSNEVTFLRSKLDWDDGRQVYDVEFYTADYTEYDYEISASTGEIIAYDFDAEGYTPPAAGSTAITADQAKAIALEKVPGAAVTDIYDFELDRDDGRLEYEGTIYYGGSEYEFTIDGYSGAVRSWEVENAHR